MGNFVVANVSIIGDSTVMVQRVEGGHESWYVEGVLILHEFTPLFQQGCTIARYLTPLPID